MTTVIYKEGYVWKLKLPKHIETFKTKKAATAFLEKFKKAYRRSFSLDSTNWVSVSK